MEFKTKIRLFFAAWTGFNIASYALVIVAFINSQPHNVHVNYANFTETYPGFAGSLSSFYTSYTDTTTLSLDHLANSGVCKNANAKDCFGNTQTNAKRPWFHYRASSNYASDFYVAPTTDGEETTAAQIKSPNEDSSIDIFEPPACLSILQTFHALTLITLIIWTIYILYHVVVLISWLGGGPVENPKYLQRCTMSISLYMYITTIFIIIFVFMDRAHNKHCQYLAVFFYEWKHAHLAVFCMLITVVISILLILCSLGVGGASAGLSRQPAFAYTSMPPGEMPALGVGGDNT